MGTDGRTSGTSLHDLAVCFVLAASTEGMHAGPLQLSSGMVASLSYQAVSSPRHRAKCSEAVCGQKSQGGPV